MFKLNKKEELFWDCKAAALDASNADYTTGKQRGMKMREGKIKTRIVFSNGDSLSTSFTKLKLEEIIASDWRQETIEINYRDEGFNIINLSNVLYITSTEEK